MSDQGKNPTTVTALRAILRDMEQSIPHLEWDVRIALAELARAQADLALARATTRLENQPHVE